MWPKAGTPEHGDALSWTVWATSELQFPLFDVIMHGCDIPWAHPKEHRSAFAADAGRKRFAECVALLDKKLEGRDFLLGKAFSLADIAVGTAVSMGPMFAGLPLEGKNASAWVARVQGRPAFGKVMSDVTGAMNGPSDLPHEERRAPERRDRALRRLGPRGGGARHRHAHRMEHAGSRRSADGNMYLPIRSSSCR